MSGFSRRSSRNARAIRNVSALPPLGIFYNESSEVARGAWISEPGVLGYAGVVDRMGENADADQFGSAALGIGEEAYRKARNWH